MYVCCVCVGVCVCVCLCIDTCSVLSLSHSLSFTRTHTLAHAAVRPDDDGVQVPNHQLQNWAGNCRRDTKPLELHPQVCVDLYVYLNMYNISNVT